MYRTAYGMATILLSKSMREHAPLLYCLAASSGTRNAHLPLFSTAVCHRTRVLQSPRQIGKLGEKEKIKFKGKANMTGDLPTPLQNKSVFLISSRASLHLPKNIERETLRV